MDVTRELAADLADRLEGALDDLRNSRGDPLGAIEHVAMVLHNVAVLST